MFIICSKFKRVLKVLIPFTNKNQRKEFKKRCGDESAELKEFKRKKPQQNCELAS